MAQRELQAAAKVVGVDSLVRVAGTRRVPRAGGRAWREAEGKLGSIWGEAG